MPETQEQIIDLDLSLIAPSPYQGRFISESEDENDPKTETGLKDLMAMLN
jgi:hypothetical protein